MKCETLSFGQGWGVFVCLEAGRCGWGGRGHKKTSLNNKQEIANEQYLLEILFKVQKVTERLMSGQTDNVKTVYLY